MWRMVTGGPLFLMHVSPIRSLDRAYLALTDKPLFSTTGNTQLSASLVP